MQRKHVVITGTGRTGTSFLVELLTHLGLDTGFDPRAVGQYRKKAHRAGLEHDMRKPGLPYVVKDPGFCDYAAEVLRREGTAIDHVFIPVRDLHAAAESRRHMQATVLSAMSPLERLITRIRRRKIGGGLWDARDHEQEVVLLDKVYRLLLALSEAAVPVTLLHFPKMVEEDRYLFQKLGPILGGLSFEQFRSVFAKVATPEIVHRFERPGHGPRPAEARAESTTG